MAVLKCLRCEILPKQRLICTQVVLKALREAAEFYTGGRGHAVPEGEDLLLHWHISEPDLTNDELDRLVDFMKTLSDESLVPSTPAQLPSGLSFKHMENNHNEKS